MPHILSLGVKEFTLATRPFVGLPIAHQFVELFWQAAQTEQQQDLFAFEVMISTHTYVQTAVAIIGVALISLILPLRYLNRLDLSRAVKERSI